MKEFKFACPVCGQHITAVEGTSGSQIECPTCFQKIIVPQARHDDTKLVLTAAKADRPRPPQANAVVDGTLAPQRGNRWFQWAALGIALVVLGAAAYLVREHVRARADHAQPEPKGTTPAAPTNTTANLPPDKWTQNIARAEMSSEPVSGALNGQSFAITRATLQGGTLSIRQGKGWPPELAVAIMFPAKRSEDLAGKNAQVSADQAPPVPKIVMRWKAADGTSATRTFSSGYTMKLSMGALEAGNNMSGQIYLALPDEQKSWLSGTFTAEIRPPDKPKTKKKAPPSGKAP